MIGLRLTLIIRTQLEYLIPSKNKKGLEKSGLFSIWKFVSLGKESLPDFSLAQLRNNPLKGVVVNSGRRRAQKLLQKFF
jgi:hypothetical protein